MPQLVDVQNKVTNQSYIGINNRSLAWYLICRTAVITFLLGGAAGFYLTGSIQFAIYPLFSLIVVSYVEAIISALVLNRIKNINLFSQLQIAWDLLFVSVLILLTGGVESIFSFAYLLIIVSASFLLSRRLTVLAAAASVVLFGGILDLQFFAYLETFGLFRSVPDGTFFSTLFVHSVAFFLSAVLSGTLADRWRKSEEQLKRKSIDLAELEKMSRTILEHINSGLMLVGLNGEIKSFNRAASDITGLSLDGIRGHRFRSVFPDLLGNISLAKSPQDRSEGIFTTPDGLTLILGYATTPAKGNRGELIGTLITFQDLTQLKRVEEDLKRSDRLAAVGRLSASMAHEIRNPLASISGSVQLLLENAREEDEDKKLMNIVVNEADRLNGLLTSFLHFARPKSPEKEEVNISQLIDELFILLKSDQRFEAVSLVKDCPDVTVMSVDPHQIQQVLWGLAVNAAEAMEERGTFKVVVVDNNSTTIIIEDSGPGISEIDRKRIFEPFFSTKEKGTGLGLASVYSVVEAHGGNITVGRSTLGGARFSIGFRWEYES